MTSRFEPTEECKLLPLRHPLRRILVLRPRALGDVLITFWGEISRPDI